MYQFVFFLFFDGHPKMAQMTSTGVSCANTKQQSRVFSLMNSRLSREFLLHLAPIAIHLLLNEYSLIRGTYDKKCFDKELTRVHLLWMSWQD